MSDLEAVGHDGHTQVAACLNCGAVLTGEHCQDCGQHIHVHRTLAAFFHDVAHGVLHFEGKMWRGLPLLLWHPGELTRDYVEGKRVRFAAGAPGRSRPSDARPRAARAEAAVGDSAASFS